MRSIIGIHRFLNFCLLFLFGAALFLFNPTAVSAKTCGSFQFTESGFPTSSTLCGAQTAYTVTVNSGSNQFLFGAGAPSYILALTTTENAARGAFGYQELAIAQASSNSSVTFSFNLAPPIDLSGNTKYYFKIYGEPNDRAEVGNISGCSLTSVKTPAITGDVYISQQRTVEGASQTCYGYPSGCLEAGIPLQINIENVRECNQKYVNKRVRVQLTGSGANLNVIERTNDEGSLPTINHTVAQSGIYSFRAEKTEGINANIAKFNLSLNGAGGCGEQCMTTRPTQPGQGETLPYKICDQIDRSQGHLMEAYDACLECVGGTDTGTEGIWTAIGCIKRDPTEIVQNLLKVGLGMGGGVALLMILAAGFLYSISQGDPKRTGEAKELITAAITGLLFIIFSVVILQFIGYTVLKIPGFGG